MYVVGSRIPLPSTPCISSTTKVMPTVMDDPPSALAAANTSSTSPTHPPDGAVASPIVAPIKPIASDGNACERLDSPSHMMTPKTLSFLGNSLNPNAQAAPPVAPPVAAVSSVPRPLGFLSFIRVTGAFYGSALHGAPLSLPLEIPSPLPPPRLSLPLPWRLRNSGSRKSEVPAAWSALQLKELTKRTRARITA